MKIFRNILFFLATSFIAFSLIEIYLYNSEIESRYSIEFSKDFGDVRISNSKFLDLNEGFGMGKFNDYGYLGPNYPKEKSEEVFRIALIGDSYVEGFQVLDRMHFRHITEKKLESKLGRKVEILNFGRSGFDLLNMYSYDSLYASQFNADLTIYFLSNRDIFNSNNNSKLPHVSLDSKENLLIKIPERPDKYNMLKYLFSRESSLYMMISKSINLASDFNFVKKKFLDKLIKPNEKKEAKLNVVNKIGQLQYQILNKLKGRNVIIVNRDVSKLNLPKDIEIINKLDIHEIFMINDRYDWSYHKWGATNKIGHYNHNAHILIADKLTYVILDYLISEK